MNLLRFLNLAFALSCFANPSMSHADIITSSNPADFFLTPQLFEPTSFTVFDLVSSSGALRLQAVTSIGDPPTIDHAYLDFTSGLTGGEYVLNGDENFNVVFSTLQSSFAFDYLDDSIASTFTLDFFDGGTNVGSSSLLTSSFGVANFIGFTSTTLFDRIDVREFDGSSNSDEYFQFYTATAVPEPSSMVLVTSVFAMAFWRRKRQ